MSPPKGLEKDLEICTFETVLVLVLVLVLISLSLSSFLFFFLLLLLFGDLMGDPMLHHHGQIEEVTM